MAPFGSWRADRLHRARKPRAIAFDVLFNELDVYRPEHDAAFADAVARYPNVWLAMTVNNDGTGRAGARHAAGGRHAAVDQSAGRYPRAGHAAAGDAPHPKAMRGGLTNFTMDSDGVGRHYARYLDRAGWRFPSLAARIVASLGRPLPKRQSVMLNYRKGWRHISYADLYIDSLRSKSLRDPNELRDKIVLVGTSAPGLMDMRLTPLDSTYPGVEVLATAIDNLDRGDWLREVPRPLRAAVRAGAHRPDRRRFRRAESAPPGRATRCSASRPSTSAAAWLALIDGTFVPVFAPLALGWVFYLACTTVAYLDERAQRLRTAGAFKRFLDPRVVNRTHRPRRRSTTAPRPTRARSPCCFPTFAASPRCPRGRAGGGRRAAQPLLHRPGRDRVQAWRHARQVHRRCDHGLLGRADGLLPTMPGARSRRRSTCRPRSTSCAASSARWAPRSRSASACIPAARWSGSSAPTRRLDYTAIGDTVNCASRIEGTDQRRFAHPRFEGDARGGRRGLRVARSRAAPGQRTRRGASPVPTVPK